MAIYVPPERLQLWQTGRSKYKINMKVKRHPGVELDMLRQYILLYEWIKGIDAAESFHQLRIPAEKLHALTFKVQEDLRLKGFWVADFKPAHIIIRKRNDGTFVRRHDEILYGVVDFELMQRTPEHEAQIQKVKRAEYLVRQRDRFTPPRIRNFPPYLKQVGILGVDYICGHVESTGGELWVVGKDPALFDYFQPERWRKTPQLKLSESHQVYYTQTKDNIHLVWKTSRVGEIPEVAPESESGRRMIDYGYNSPFEEFSYALAVNARGIPATYPRAIYMTGPQSEAMPYIKDRRRYESHAGLTTPDGQPILRPDHDYIKIWGFWNGPRRTAGRRKLQFFPRHQRAPGPARGAAQRPAARRTDRAHARAPGGHRLRVAQPDQPPPAALHQSRGEPRSRRRGLSRDPALQFRNDAAPRIEYRAGGSNPMTEPPGKQSLAIAPRPDPRLPAPSHVDSGSYKVCVRADYYEGQIDLKQFRARYPHYPVLATNPLVLEPEKNSYVILTRFGAVVVWDCSDAVLRDLYAEIESLSGVLNRNDAVRDQLTVHIGMDQDVVTFNEVWLRELTLEKLKIIALTLAQSVALDRFENEVTLALARFNPVITALRGKGQLKLSEAEVLRAVGFALEVRAAVLANLTLFDDPPETWESETLAYLDNQLYDQFDLEERLSAINQKLIFLTDMNSTLTTLLSNRKSHRLEWIVIVLIAVEIVLYMVESDFVKVWDALFKMLHH